MPELPEVETTVKSLNILKSKKVINLNIHTKKLRYPIPLNKLKKIINSKIINLRRIAKYIIVDLNTSKSYKTSSPFYFTSYNIPLEHSVELEIPVASVKT